MPSAGRHSGVGREERNQWRLPLFSNSSFGERSEKPIWIWDIQGLPVSKYRSDLKHKNREAVSDDLTDKSAWKTSKNNKKKG